MNRPSPIRLLLVDSHALTRAALGCLLACRPGMTVAGEAATLADGVARAAASAPDVILLRLRHGWDLGVDAIPPLVQSAPPDTRLVVMTELAGPDLHRRALRAGASGIVGTDRSAETLFTAIEKVLQGEVWVEGPLATPTSQPCQSLDLDRAPDRIGSLTPREREVVRLLCEGLRNKQIADRLAVADVTVRHHLTSVFSKLGVSDRLGLLLYASKHGLAPVGTLVPSHPVQSADGRAHDEQ